MCKGSWELSQGKLAGALAVFFVVATGAGTWAAYSYSYAAAEQMNAAAAGEAKATAPQFSNAEAKTDRLASQPAPVSFEAAVPQETPPPSYQVAALASTPAEPPKLRLEPRAEPRKPAPAPDKPKRAESQKLLLDDAQIAALRSRLKLTPTQEEFWPAVEVTLRQVIRTHARKGKSGQGAIPQIDANSPEVQQLISAAVPLIMRLSEEQKHEVRQLARIIGLETVASKI
jgi:hypothetical protein